MTKVGGENCNLSLIVRVAARKRRSTARERLIYEPDLGTNQTGRETQQECNESGILGIAEKQRGGKCLGGDLAKGRATGCVESGNSKWPTAPEQEGRKLNLPSKNIGQNTEGTLEWGASAKLDCEYQKPTLGGGGGKGEA